VKLVLTGEAIRDLAEIYEFIAKGNAIADDKHRDKLKTRCRNLLDQPRMGTKRDEVDAGLRSVTEGNYVIFYRVLRDRIEVVRVLHTSRDAKRVLSEND
jgi:toxin ParE1/3/4